MEKCLIIINKKAGGGEKIDFTSIENRLGGSYIYECAFIPCEDAFDFSAYDAVAIAGGDGTFSTVLQELYSLNKEVYYFPAGTLNDKAKAELHKRLRQRIVKRSGAGFKIRSKANDKTRKIDNQTKSANGAAFTEFAQEYPAVPEYQSSAHTVSDEQEKTLFAAKPLVIGKANGKLFTYVTAAGSFTPIGYEVDEKYKKKYGILAYVGKIFKEFRIHRIPAKIVVGDKSYEGDFTLIMFLKSPRCFGFPFNRAYDEEDVSGHLIAVRSPKGKGPLSYARFFFLFFRVFFLGLKKEREGRIIFRKISDCDVYLDGQFDFCHDGELQTFKKHMRIEFEKTVCDVGIIDKTNGLK